MFAPDHDSGLGYIMVYDNVPRGMGVCMRGRVGSE